MLLANSLELKAHLREVSPSDYSESSFHHHAEEFKIYIPSEGKRFDIETIDQQSPRNNWLPSPAPTSDSPSAPVAESLLQDPKSKSTILPSFKELDAFPIYIRTPQLDMLPTPQNNQKSGHDPHSDKYTEHETFSTAHYPYNHRYLQGEPNYPSLTAPYHRSTSISTAMPPYEIPRTVHPANLIRPSHTFQRGGKPTRGDPEYTKRPRRRADEVERLYDCNFPGCTKAYGALNHLNTHVRDAQHGPKREPKEFKEIRRQQKLQLARERQQQNVSMYRVVDSHEQRAASPYGQLPPPYVHPRGISQETEPSARPLYHPYSDYPNGHFQHPSVNSQEWRPASPSRTQSTAGWSPDNYYDLHHRHPSFAKDLISERPHSRETTHSLRDDHLYFNGDRYDSLGYPSYVQGPNGPTKRRDSSYHYEQKEF